jgi:hypothetical protein
MTSHLQLIQEVSRLKRSLINVLGAAVLSLAALPFVGTGNRASVEAAETVAVAPVVATAAPASRAPARPAASAAAASASALAAVVDVVGPELGGAEPEVLNLALSAVRCAQASGDIDAPPTLTLIDYSRPSLEPRLWVYDLRTRELLFKELVAHGRNSGDNIATEFSDAMNSHQTSIGLFVTDKTYVGSNGYSLRLDGLEPGFNGRARDRAIVMHGAPYVDPQAAAKQGRLGRSWGCPALRQAVARDVIDTIAGGGVIFSYYPDQDWLKTSRFLNGCAGA